MTYPPHQPHPVVIARQVPTSGTATAALVLGIFGVLGGWCLLGIPCIVAIVAGHVALKQTAGGAMAGRGSAVAGLIMGYVFAVPWMILGFSMLMGFANVGTGGAVAP